MWDAQTWQEACSIVILLGHAHFHSQTVNAPVEWQATMYNPDKVIYTQALNFT